MPGQRHSQPIPTSFGSRVYAYLSVTCHLHFWQNDRSLFTCHCSNMGVERTPNGSAQKVNSEKENLPPFLPAVWLNTRAAAKIVSSRKTSRQIESKSVHRPSGIHVTVCLKRIGENEVERSGTAKIRKAQLLAVGETCKAIY